MDKSVIRDSRSQDQHKSRMKTFIKTLMSNAKPYVEKNKYFVDLAKMNQVRISVMQARRIMRKLSKNESDSL